MLVMLVILVMGITTVFFTTLSGTALKNHRNQSTAASLALAKEALIGYAVTYGDTQSTKPHGFLPCPDTDGSAGANPEGSSELCGTTNVDVLGRLPWRTLDLPTLFDGAGECLWYAVSGNYKNTRTYPPVINWDNPGQLHVYDSNSNEISPGEIVAVVIAPGTALSSNADRTGNAAPTCGGNYNTAAYLDNDTVHGINNSNISQGKFILPHEDSSTVSTNDQIAFITRQDIWNSVQKRIARQAKQCLDDYASDPANTNNKYPWATELTDATAVPRDGTLNVRFGRFPDTPNTSTTTSGGSCPDTSSPLSSLSATRIATLNNYIQQVQDALNTYIANPNSTTRDTLKDKGDNLWDLAKNWPYYLPIGDPIRSAGWWVDNYCGSSSTCNTTTIQSMLNAAFSEINDCTSSADSTMPSSWSASCQAFISSPSWAAWRDWIFLQIADGYQPGGAGSCTTDTTCLGISGSAHTNTGSGSYHAVVVAASKAMSGQNRSVIGTVSNFLEGANATGKTATPSTTNFVTYRPSDNNYNTVNDLALCIDGKTNCR